MNGYRTPMPVNEFLEKITRDPKFGLVSLDFFFKSLILGFQVKRIDILKQITGLKYQKGSESVGNKASVLAV